MSLQQYKARQFFFCGYKILTEGVFATHCLVMRESQFDELCGLRQTAVSSAKYVYIYIYVCVCVYTHIRTYTHIQVYVCIGRGGRERMFQSRLTEETFPLEGGKNNRLETSV